jgi:hypothetical protein
MATKKSLTKKKTSTKQITSRVLPPAGGGRLLKLRLDKSGISVLPWREAWAEAGEPWIEWVETVWGRRDPQGGQITDPIDPLVSATELWLRFRAAEPAKPTRPAKAAAKAVAKSRKPATGGKKKK